jgi:hypothetical protein
MRINGKACRLHAIIDGTKIEPGAIKASEAEKLLAWTGYNNLREWELRVTDGDALACRALLALMRFRDGEHVRIADVDIEDVDSIEADLRTEDGQVATLAVNDDGEPMVVKGELVWEFDGEPVDPPRPQESLDA